MGVEGQNSDCNERLHQDCVVNVVPEHIVDRVGAYAEGGLAPEDEPGVGDVGEAKVTRFGFDGLEEIERTSGR